MKKLGFLGAGNMGGAIIKGIVANGFKVELFAYDKDEKKLEEFKKYGVKPCQSELELAEKCEYLLLAVKPQVLGDALNKLKEKVSGRHVIISICAGISSDFIKEHTDKSVRTVIVMPNTPAMLGVGALQLLFLRFYRYALL